jgi:hypothetical protein
MFDMPEINKKKIYMYITSKIKLLQTMKLLKPWMRCYVKALFPSWALRAKSVAGRAKMTMPAEYELLLHWNSGR